MSKLDCWAAIAADPELKRAREKLSLHELRLIILHAKREETERCARIVDEWDWDEKGAAIAAGIRAPRKAEAA